MTCRGNVFKKNKKNQSWSRISMHDACFFLSLSFKSYSQISAQKGLIYLTAALTAVLIQDTGL